MGKTGVRTRALFLPALSGDTGNHVTNRKQAGSMATYIVGDIQGCFSALQCVLETAEFDPAKDTLWCVGDLVNRGPQSLATLRFLYDRKTSIRLALGNHDLHLLALYHGVVQSQRNGNTLGAVLSAPDAPQLCQWLLEGSMLIHDPVRKVLVCHAGVPHIWDRRTTLACAAEVETALRGPDYAKVLAGMYGNKPRRWRDDLADPGRTRLIINYLTRMRLVNHRGKLNLDYKGPISGKLPGKYLPWFHRRHPDWEDYRFFFGHWAALDGHTRVPWAIALDTGCVWGNKLTMLRLDDDRRIECDCRKHHVS